MDSDRDFLIPLGAAKACDERLVGGHRRIHMSGLTAFLPAKQHQIVRPEVLGLPATAGQTERVIDRAADNLVEALVRGDQDQCGQITLDLYLAEHSITAICDQVFAKAFESIGDRWQCGEAEVYQERRGCELALRVLHKLESMVPQPPSDSLKAIGGAPAGNQYNLATTMVELVLREAKWNAMSLGNNLPFATLAAAIKEHRPRLFWLSCSHIEDEASFLSGYENLYDEFGLDVAIVVGGRALTEELRQQMKYAAYCDNMQHLEGFARTLQRANEQAVANH